MKDYDREKNHAYIIYVVKKRPEKTNPLKCVFEVI